MPPTSRNPGSSAPRAGTGGKNIMRPSRPIGVGVGKSVSGKMGAKGLGRARGPTRHNKIKRDTILGITKGDIRRLARRGGVKRISVQIYDDIRSAMKVYMGKVLKDCSEYVEYANRKTVTVTDVIFALKRIGKPIYGFDADSYNPKRR